MNELKNYPEILSMEAQKVEQVIETYTQDDPEIADPIEKCMDDFRRINASKINATQPQIMVYGIYNAGKSSILNELMGEDRATVADVPQTDKIDPYTWNGYTILDTPGVGAPIAHENVTQRQLREADIVIFVMSTTGSSEKLENYTRMKDIADAGKKIIIVLNDKNGDLGSNDGTIEKIKAKVGENMQQVGIQNVNDKYEIIAVNAKRAQIGRLHKDPAKGAMLIEKSNMDYLKGVILQELKRTNRFEIYRNAINEIDKLLAQILKILNTRTNQSMDLEPKIMSRALSRFESQKSVMRRSMNAYIERQTDTLGRTLPIMIWENRSASEEISRSEVEKVQRKIQHELEKNMTEALEIINEEIQSDIAQLQSSNQDTSDLNVEIRSVEFNPTNSEGESNLLPALIGAAGAGELATGAVSRLATRAIASLATNIVGRAATANIVPVIGQIASAGMMLYSAAKILGRGNKDQINAELEAKNRQAQLQYEAEQQARQDLDQKCLYFASELEDNLKNSVDQAINEMIKTYAEPYKSKIATLESESKYFIEGIDALNQIRDEYHALLTELGEKASA